MDCRQAIAFIRSLEKFGIKPGLERVRALCAALGDPQERLEFVHVAGTNGKGTTSTMISEALIKSGRAVGLFVSPYVVDFRERIQYNGEPIEENELGECVEKVKNATEELEKKRIVPTEFEAVTAAAFLYFEKKKCDVAVLEAGLGGRLDSTNVIKSPLVSVITSLSFDHEAVLGRTIEEIAFEKCGIIKPNGITVLYPIQKEGALRVVERIALERSNELIIPDLKKLKIHSLGTDGTSASYDGLDFKLSLAGERAVYDACAAAEAVRSLSRAGINVSDGEISEGLASSRLPARLELIKTSPVVLLDGGHNEGCAEALRDFVEKALAGRKITMICSIMADKNYEAYLRVVAPLADRFIASRAAVPRALESGELKKAAERFCGNCSDIPNPEDALKEARKGVSENDALIVCGSLYFAGEIRDLLYKF